MVCDTVSNIVCQVALLPFYTGSLYCCEQSELTVALLLSGPLALLLILCY